MTHLRAILAIIAGGAFGVLVAELILGLGPRGAGVCIAVMAACVIGIYLARAIQADRDKRRAYRDRVWQRRIEQGIAGARPKLPNRKGMHR